MKKITTATLLMVFAVGTIFLGMTPAVFAKENTAQFEKEWTAFYKDIFDQNFYSEGVNQLDLGRWWRKIFRKKIPSANINAFDEVPDSNFFTNRHARARLSAEALEKGYHEEEGADLSQPLTVIAAEQQGIHYGFIVEDAKKDRYFLKFDSQGHLELNTGAEVIASRFYYALGYNVPQYNILFFKPDQIKVSEDAITYDNTGFVKKLTQPILEKYLLAIPQLPGGTYRASASKLFKAQEAGDVSFWSRKKEDPQEVVHHRDRRDFRGLRVFSAWLNNENIRESNALYMKTNENGQVAFKPYLFGFATALGAAMGGDKPPMLGYEYLADYGEAFKSFLALGFREKPWQKKWREASEKNNPLSSVGYFSSEHFDPARYKTLLPYEAFRLVTSADGFWAAKNVMAFSDEDIRTMVKAGQYSDSAAADSVTQTLIERRDKIGRYWFLQANPLDGFAFSDGKLSFKDLAIDYKFIPKERTMYHVEVVSSGKNPRRIAELKISEPILSIQPEWFQNDKDINLIIRVARPFAKELGFSVSISLNTVGIQGIRHQD